ncbi:MAG: Rab family GTPase [Promethearchaeota archaeon]
MSDYLFKVMLAGGGRYKTAILKRFTTGHFKSDTKTTIGVDFAIHEVVLPDGGSATLQLWDFELQERHLKLLPLFVSGSSGALIFFDFDQPQTFDELHTLVPIIRKNTRNIPIILCGTNWDETIPEYVITEAVDILQFIESNNIQEFYKVDGKTGHNVDVMFNSITQLMIEGKWKL